MFRTIKNKSNASFQQNQIDKIYCNCELNSTFKLTLDIIISFLDVSYLKNVFLDYKLFIRIVLSTEKHKKYRSIKQILR